MPNPARNTWVAYFGERVALFGVVIGVALLLAGIGFIVLAVGGALRHGAQPATSSPGGGTPTVETRELGGVH